MPGIQGIGPGGDAGAGVGMGFGLLPPRPPWRTGETDEWCMVNRNSGRRSAPTRPNPIHDLCKNHATSESASHGHQGEGEACRAARSTRLCSTR
jgi:hypothetical protein